MVCLPCIVIPLLLWVFHRFLQPYLLPLMPARIQKWFSVKAEKMEHYGGPPPENTSESEKTPSCPMTTGGQTATTEIKAGEDKKTD
ncbi:UPF0729 protein C18orf32 homolog [Asterias amurensis]|uniref:UPF0729 protein C18orf32 homolog n=1 Tax=Asterias amurensis TaxID=7602 RepID=UPI003AB2F626